MWHEVHGGPAALRGIGHRTGSRFQSAERAFYALDGSGSQKPCRAGHGPGICGRRNAARPAQSAVIPFAGFAVGTTAMHRQSPVPRLPEIRIQCILICALVRMIDQKVLFLLLVRHSTPSAPEIGALRWYSENDPQTPSRNSPIRGGVGNCSVGKDQSASATTLAAGRSSDRFAAAFSSSAQQQPPNILQKSQNASKAPRKPPPAEASVKVSNCGGRLPSAICSLPSSCFGGGLSSVSASAPAALADDRCGGRLPSGIRALPLSYCKSNPGSSSL